LALSVSSVNSLFTVFFVRRGSIFDSTTDPETFKFPIFYANEEFNILILSAFNLLSFSTFDRSIFLDASLLLSSFNELASQENLLNVFD